MQQWGEASQLLAAQLCTVLFQEPRRRKGGSLVGSPLWAWQRALVPCFYRNRVTKAAGSAPATDLEVYGWLGGLGPAGQGGGQARGGRLRAGRGCHKPRLRQVDCALLQGPGPARLTRPIVHPIVRPSAGLRGPARPVHARRLRRRLQGDLSGAAGHAGTGENGLSAAPARAGTRDPRPGTGRYPRPGTGWYPVRAGTLYGLVPCTRDLARAGTRYLILGTGRYPAPDTRPGPLRPVPRARPGPPLPRGAAFPSGSCGCPVPRARLSAVRPGEEPGRLSRGSRRRPGCWALGLRCPMALAVVSRGAGCVLGCHLCSCPTILALFAC